MRNYVINAGLDEVFWECYCLVVVNEISLDFDASGWIGLLAVPYMVVR